MAKVVLRAGRRRSGRTGARRGSDPMQALWQAVTGKRLRRIPSRAIAKQSPSSQLHLHLKAHGLTDGMLTERTFHPTRKWRFDYCWPARRLAVEVQGGTWAQGRHTRGAGYEADCEKFAEAAVLGWTVIGVTSQQIRSGQAIAWVQALHGITIRETRSGKISGAQS